jgi:hypothetical protein
VAPLQLTNIKCDVVYGGVPNLLQLLASLHLHADILRVTVVLPIITIINTTFTMVARLFVILALAGCLASAARLPDVQLVESELPESVIAFQGSELHAQNTEDNNLDLGESPTGGTWNCCCRALWAPAAS